MGVSVSMLGESPCNILVNILPASYVKLIMQYFFHKSHDCLICKENRIGIRGVNVAHMS